MKHIQPARIEWCGDQQPFATDFGDGYFSREDGRAETRHVFIEGNQLPRRWITLQEKQFVIGETGFGTGLNFLSAWQLWNDLAPTDARLTFISAELHPLRKDDLEKVSKLWPELESLYAQLLAQYPPLTAGFHVLHFDRVTLILLLGDATEMFSQVDARVDAWFLDGFAPARNPTLWQPGLLNIIANLSKHGSTAATFTAAGEVRRNLEAVGFDVKKRQGFGSKRDMTAAHFAPPIPARHKVTSTPWHQVRNPQAPTGKVTVIGAGIAGCTIAHTLATRGLQVTVLENREAVALEASGNRQAVLYSKWGVNEDPLSLFNLSAYLHALRFYVSMERCGVLHLAWSEAEMVQQQYLQDFFSHYPDIARFVTRAEAADIAGVAVNSGGLFFHQAGWLQPALVCQQLLEHPNISVQFNTRITSLPTQETTIIATGHLATTWPQTAGLPLKSLRGQVSHGKPTAISKNLKTVLSGDGYIAPALDDLQSFGATYTPGVTDLALTCEEHTQNREGLATSSLLLAQQWANENIAGGRAHFRAATTDYLPLCGPVPDPETFRKDYARLGKNARATIPLAGSYYPHLYICAGLGSRGMTYAPLCAEIIASQILQTPAPLPGKLMQALNPARFVIRDLMKNR